MFEPPPVAEETVPFPSRPTPRGVPQKSLVVQPLPLDISKLPLESSQSDGFTEVFAPHLPDSLPPRGQDHDQVLTLPGEGFLTTIHQDTGTPSLQTKVRPSTA